MKTRIFILLVQLFIFCAQVSGRVGDVQMKSDHSWYPGELACSTFDRLFAFQSQIYTRTTGRTTVSDQDKAVASWFFRNIYYYHAFEGHEDLGYTTVGATPHFNDDYWKGLFAYGHGECAPGHNQMTAEMEYKLGHCRARQTAVGGHSSFEVWLTGTGYGSGNWAVMNCDQGTVVFDTSTYTYMLGLHKVVYEDQQSSGTNYNNYSKYSSNAAPNANQGWYKNSMSSWYSINFVGYCSGYPSVPPVVELRSGEKLRRYLKPGLADGNTYVFFGYNQVLAGVGRGPVRDVTWCNQPDKMYRATSGTGSDYSRGIYGNGVYTYTPNFSDDSYKEGVISEDTGSVTFYFCTPYVIGGRPALARRNLNDSGDLYPFMVDYAGATEGLVITGSTVGCTVQVSSDNGNSWASAQTLSNSLDLTDYVKGNYSYFLRFNTAANNLKSKNLTIKTVTQCNERLIPHLKDNGSTLTYQASGKAVFNAGPGRKQAQKYIISGGFNTSGITMEIPTPHGEKILEVYASALVGSGVPPNTSCIYKIDYSVNNGTSWESIVDNWQIVRRGWEPSDFLSTSFYYGNKDISSKNADSVRVRFSNNGEREYKRAEVYLVYESAVNSPMAVRFNYTDTTGNHTAENTYPAGAVSDASWTIPTVGTTVTNWVEYDCSAATGDLPASPSNFQGMALSSASIIWSWKDNSSNETGFKVKTSTGGTIADLSAGATYWAETKLIANTNYTRYAVAYSTSGESASISASAYTQAGPLVSPTNFKGKATGIDKIQWSWEDKSGNESGFRIKNE
ncbi:MAG: hypothetical protein ABIA17_06590, partial [Elusimicrobiota bacterium]